MNHRTIPTNRKRNIRSLRDTLPNFDNFNLTGAAAAIVKNGELVYSAAAGVLDADTRRLVKTDSVFQAASLSKLVNALGILRLVQEGQIKLGDDIRDYVGSMMTPTHPNQNSKPSIRRLLRHHGGTSQHGFSGYPQQLNPLPTLDEIISGSGPANHPAIIFTHVPGAQYDYSGGGTMLLQKAVEVITGERYQCWMKREVLVPLNMVRSSFKIGPPHSLVDESEIASGHKLNGRVWPGKRRHYPESAAASFLAPNLIDKMLNTGQTANIGLGCFMSQNGIWSHSGSNKGFLCQIEGCPNQNAGLILLTNTDDPNGNDNINPMLDYFIELKRIHDL